MIKNLDKLTWHQAMIAVAALVLTAALSVDMPGIEDSCVIAAALSAIFWGLAEMACWTTQTSFLSREQTPAGYGAMQVTSPVWRPTFQGVVLYLLCLGSVCWLISSLLGFWNGADARPGA